MLAEPRNAPARRHRRGAEQRADPEHAIQSRGEAGVQRGHVDAGRRRGAARQRLQALQRRRRALAPGGEEAVQRDVEHPAEDRRAQRVADGAHQEVQRGGDAALAPADAALDGDDEGRVQYAEARADHERSGARGERALAGEQRDDHAAGEHRDAAGARQPRRADANQDVARDVSRQRPADRHHAQGEARHERRVAEHALDEDRQEADQPHHRHAGGERREVGEADQPVVPQLDVQHGIRRAALLAQQQPECRRGERHQRRRARDAQAAALGEGEHQRGQRDQHQAGAGVIDVALAVLDALVQMARQQRDAGEAERDVDPEHPGPRQVLDDERAGERAEHRRDAPHARHVALHAGALLDAVHVADQRGRERLDRARAEPLHEAERDQRGHRPGEPAQRRCDEEDRDPDDEQPLPAERVRELSVDRDADGLHEQVRGEHPAVERQPAQLRRDARHRGGDDGGLDRGHEHRHDDRGKDQRAAGLSGACGSLHRVRRRAHGMALTAMRRAQASYARPAPDG